MFDNRAFHTWAHVLVGALWFAGLFALVELMAAWLLDGTFQMSCRAAALAAAAFVGYVGVAHVIRRRPSPE